MGGLLAAALILGLVAGPAGVAADTATSTAAPAPTAARTSTAAAAPPSAPPATTAAPPSSLPQRRLYIQGDSVMVGALQDVTNTLRADGWAGTITGFTGLHTYAALPLFQQVRPTMGSVAVIELGANDCCDGGSFGIEIDKVMRILSGLHVIWLTMPDWKPGVAGMNQAMWAAARRWPALQVADWAAELAAHPEDGYPDGPHLTAGGSALLARYLKSVLDSWYDGPERTYDEDLGGAPYLNGGGWLPASGTVVGAASAPSAGGHPGFWAADSRGGVYTYGAAPFFGSAANERLSAPIVGMAATPDGGGYWLVGSDGGVFTFGDAGFFGSTGGKALSAPIAAMASTPDGKGYWLVGSDGGVFTFGDAGFFGSTGGKRLAAAVNSVAATPDGKGYWLAAADGGVFAFGDAAFYGSGGELHLVAPVIGITASSDGAGYWLVGSDGGVFSYGDAGFGGAGQTLVGPVHVRADYSALVPARAGGYWLVGQAPAAADAAQPVPAPAPAVAAVGAAGSGGPPDTGRGARPPRSGGPDQPTVAALNRSHHSRTDVGLAVGVGLIALAGTLIAERRRQVAVRRAARLAVRAERTAERTTEPAGTGRAPHL